MNDKQLDSITDEILDCFTCDEEMMSEEGVLRRRIREVLGKSNEVLQKLAEINKVKLSIKDTYFKKILLGLILRKIKIIRGLDNALSLTDSNFETRYPDLYLNRHDSFVVNIFTDNMRMTSQDYVIRWSKNNCIILTSITGSPEIDEDGISIWLVSVDKYTYNSISELDLLFNHITDEIELYKE